MCGQYVVTVYLVQLAKFSILNLVEHEEVLLAGIYILVWPESENTALHRHLRTGCKIAATLCNMD